MRFQAPIWLFGCGLGVVIAVLLIAGGLLLVRSIRRFGDEALVMGLVTGRPGGRRALKGGLLVFAVALAFGAMAEPQYGRGTRLIPATNLDVVIVLDFSKSMYARDIPPSRIDRAKAEVSRLIGDLPGARFGAVAFAGEPMAFPLTSDGAAIAQFFRQLSPNDMPVGGTAIGRALERGRELFTGDPLSAKHQKVLVLVTDGEDLEGDPVSVARAAAQEGIAVSVVQVGGRTPEPIPAVDDQGRVKGYRTDAEGKPLTTSLSAEGEAQLAQVAEVGGGYVVRSEKGGTGIQTVASRLRRLMTEELSERVETVYADVYAYPLALAVFLLLIEAFVNETRPRARAIVLPPPAKPSRRRRRTRARSATTAIGLLALLVSLPACSKRRSLFERYAPGVDQAIDALDAGDAGAAVGLLEEYLSTGKCENGEIGAPGPVRERSNATFDLGLGLFRLAERFGARFGEEDAADAGAGPDHDRRASEIDCALRIVRVIASDGSVPFELRARAAYLTGNLEFLNGDYRAAVKSYDAALKIVPGLPLDAGDLIGRDAAHNRAIALRRIEDQDKDAEPPDAGPPDAGESPDAGPPDAGGDQDAGPPDAGSEPDAGDQGNEPDAGPDGSAPTPEAGPPDAGPPDAPQDRPQAPHASADDRILDELEQAPTLQEKEAKDRAMTGRVGGMEDK